MAEEFELTNIDETRNYFIEEIEQNELMSKKHKKFCVTLDYIEHFFTLASAVTGCILYRLLFLQSVFVSELRAL